MPNSPSQMIPDMLNWRQIWVSGRPRKGSDIQFPCARHHSKRRRRLAGVKSSTPNGHRYPKCSSARCLPMVREETGSPSEMLPMPGWQLMNHLAVHVHFLRCGDIIDDWSVKGVLSLVFEYMTSLGSSGPTTSSQHNHSCIIDELLSKLPSCQ
ncbi:uncharacterized protein TNCV_3103621 [Trichonephila clavipes]|nr:uncharacterized protein TNCV_3103621 [Trichonephila clavipes]